MLLLILIPLAILGFCFLFEDRGIREDRARDRYWERWGE